MTKKLLIICMIALFLFCHAQAAFCYWVDTHRTMTKKAADLSGFESKSVEMGMPAKAGGRDADEWLKFGSEKEDDTFSEVVMRYLNHFYDPYNNRGLNDGPFVGNSSYSWAGTDAQNRWTWGAARASFCNALKGRVS